MRGLVPGLLSPHPLGERLPGLYQADAFVQGLTAALDEVLAPLLSSLDNLDAYCDPQLAPDDFLDCLAGWVGLEVDESWPAARRRALVAEAGRLYPRRGTPAGLAAWLRLLTGAEVEVEETGGTAWHTSPGSPLPGRPGNALLVRVRAGELGRLGPSQLEGLVAEAKPAHVVHRLEVVESPPPMEPALAPEAGPPPVPSPETAESQEQPPKDPTEPAGSG